MPDEGPTYNGQTPMGSTRHTAGCARDVNQGCPVLALRQHSRRGDAGWGWNGLGRGGVGMWKGMRYRSSRTIRTIWMSMRILGRGIWKISDWSEERRVR